MGRNRLNILAASESMLLVAACAGDTSDGESGDDSSAEGVVSEGDTVAEEEGSGVYAPEIKTPYVPNCPHHEAVS